MFDFSRLKRRRGKQSQAAKDAHHTALVDFCDALRQIQSASDFKISSRGLCYSLEEYSLLKGDFDAIQKTINDCRKDGYLPVHFTADDDNRAPKCMERDVDDMDPEEFAEWLAEDVLTDYLRYYPMSIWEDQDYYVEVAVEKIDLRSLFEPVCKKFNIPLTNIKGWSDINSRARMMERFRQHEEAGRQCVLLYCGDHDPGGLNISGALRKNLEDLENAEGVTWSPENLIIERFGLNYDFIQENNLTWIENLETGGKPKPGKKKYPLDHPEHPDHHKPYVQSYLELYGARKVEANALVVIPDEARQMCREAILKYVDQDEVDAHAEHIDAEREKVRELIPAALEEVLGR